MKITLPIIPGIVLAQLPTLIEEYACGLRRQLKLEITIREFELRYWWLAAEAPFRIQIDARREGEEWEAITRYEPNGEEHNYPGIPCEVFGQETQDELANEDVEEGFWTEEPLPEGVQELLDRAGSYAQHLADILEACRTQNPALN